MRDSQLFDYAVESYFGPFSRMLSLPLSKVREGIYDIPSEQFILRIRLDTGHCRGLNVLLRPSSSREFDENYPGIQLGIGCFLKFHGEDPSDTLIEVSSDEDFMEQARLLAAAATKYAVPYLHGEGIEWNAVNEMVQREAKKAVLEIKKYRFLK